MELITFGTTDDGRKIIAIESNITGDLLYLDDKSYKNYETALTRVGSILDKIDYPAEVILYKKDHPLSCPDFRDGYKTCLLVVILVASKSNSLRPEIKTAEG